METMNIKKILLKELSDINASNEIMVNHAGKFEIGDALRLSTNKIMVLTALQKYENGREEVVL